MALLKEKAKELKSTQKKLSKIEGKSVQLFKDNQALQQDHKTFVEFLKLVFKEQHLGDVLLPDDQIGVYDIEYLRKFWFEN